MQSVFVIILKRIASNFLKEVFCNNVGRDGIGAGILPDLSIVHGGSQLNTCELIVLLLLEPLKMFIPQPLN